jgi:hypothetical protein
VVGSTSTHAATSYVFQTETGSRKYSAAVQSTGKNPFALLKSPFQQQEGHR